MILALAGTNPYSFERLIRPLDELAGRHGWDVFIQLGHTDYQPRHCRHGKFVDREKVLDMIRQADVVITQGGYGSIRDALSCDRPVVAVPRYPGLGEATDHQEEMVRAMEARGYLLGVYDIVNLESAIESARHFRPAAREQSTIPQQLGEYLAAL